MSTLKNEKMENMSKNPNVHCFHIVNPSLWPLCMSLSLYNLLMGFLSFFNFFLLGYISLDLITYHFTLQSPLLYFGIFCFFMTSWFQDVMSEATFEGYHTKAVQIGMQYGMVLFIVSEMMFFFSFFWAFFHMSFSPNMYLGLIWPPLYINLLDGYSLPLWNTMMLLSSGITVTYSHSAILAGDSLMSLDGLLWTVSYGLLFTCIQGYEYCYSNYSINDGAYGSIFFLLTGFHGLHVMMGSMFLIVCFWRHVEYHFSDQHHLGMELAILYWHMVDAIWLFLYFLVYLK